MKDEFLAEHWPVLLEAYGFSAFIGCDVEQFREEVLLMVLKIDLAEHQ